MFEIVNGYDLVYNWLSYLKDNLSVKTTGYVIMPNHVHCIFFFPADQFDLSMIVGNGKRFIAYETIYRLKVGMITRFLCSFRRIISKANRERPALKSV